MDPLDERKLDDKEKKAKVKKVSSGMSKLLERLSTEESKKSVILNWNRCTETFRDWENDGTLKLHPMEFIQRVYERVETAKKTLESMDLERGGNIMYLNVSLGGYLSESEEKRATSYGKEDEGTSRARILSDIGRNAAKQLSELEEVSKKISESANSEKTQNASPA